MKLKKLTIKIQDLDNFFDEINLSVQKNSNLSEKKETIIFDHIDSFQSFMTLNKRNILSAISNYKPASVYELAKILNRKPQHVLTECRSLESHGFIQLIPEELNRKTLRPKLLFNYDIIMIEESHSMPIIISQRSKKLLELAI